MPSTVSVLLLTPGRERPTLRRALQNTLEHAGLRTGDEVLVGNPGGDAAVAAAAAWAGAGGWSPATVRDVPLPTGPSEGAVRNALADAAGGDLLVWLDDADLFYGNGVELLRAASDEAPGKALIAYRAGRGGNRDRLVVARRGSRGNWLAPAGYIQDTVARHGQAREIQAVVYLVRPLTDRW